MPASSNDAPLSVDDIYAMLDASGKGPPKPASWATFLATALFGVPLFVGVLVPGVALTMMAKAVLGLVLPSDAAALAPIDSGIKAPKEEDLIPRPKRTYDIIVLGATGFTGKLVVEYLAREYSSEQNKIKWAMAGRSQSKLDAVKKEVAEWLGKHDEKENPLSDIPTILVDTSQPDTLPALVKDSRCIITTVGPFETYGSPVVEACAKYGTHYIDTTGEVGWANTMQLAWQETAQKTGAKIVSLCGNDSIPTDISTMQLEKFFADRGGETLTRVEFFYDFVAGLSGGTLATMKHGLSGHSRQDPKHEFDANYRLADGTESQSKTDLTQMSIIPSNTGWSGRYAKWTKSFTIMSGVNGRVVQRSHALRNHNNNAEPLVYQEWEVVQDFKSGFVNVMSLFLTFGLMAIPPTRALVSQLLPKQGEGPTRKDMFETYYCALAGQGTGSKGTKVQSVLYFDKCVGYASTARMVVESALCLVLSERRSDGSKKEGATGKLSASKLQSGDKGGFFTPSTGMGLALFDRLIASKTCYFAMKEVKE